MYQFLIIVFPSIFYNGENIVRMIMTSPDLKITGTNIKSWDKVDFSRVWILAELPTLECPVASENVVLVIETIFYHIMQVMRTTIKF